MNSTKPTRHHYQQFELDDPQINLKLRPQDSSTSSSGNHKELVFENLSLKNPQFEFAVSDSAGESHLLSSGKNVSAANFKFQNDAGTRIMTSADLTIDLDKTSLHNGKMLHISTEGFRANIPLLSKRAKDPPQVQINSFESKGSAIHSIRFNDSFEIRNDRLSVSRLPILALQKNELISLLLKLPAMQIGKTDIIKRSPKNSLEVLSLEMDTQREYFQLDSIAFINRLPRDSFFMLQPFEKDYITITTGKMQMESLKPMIRLNDTILYARKITLNPLNLKVERDKRRPDDTIAYRPLVAGIVQKIPFPVQIDSVVLQQSLIWHNVIDEKTEKEGTIYFMDVNGLIRNIRNIDLAANDTLRIRVHAYLMGQGLLDVDLRESYRDTLQTFLLSARMGKMEMAVLNQLLIPLANLRVDQGSIDSLWLQVKADDYLAFGSMEMDYRQLKVALLNRVDQRRDFLSWLANIVVRSKNHKKGLIYTERLRNKSVFNYWARISLQGLLTSIGVKGSKKQSRKYRKRRSIDYGP